MARSVTVNADHVIVGGAEHKTSDVVTISNTEFSQLTTAGAFAGGSPILTDGGAVSDADDAVNTQAALVANPAALTSAAAVGANPTKAEFDKTVVDLGVIRTNQIAILTALKGAGKPMSAT